MKHLHLLYTLLFGVAVLLFFGLAYPHHLHYQEQYQLFLFDGSYVWNIVRMPGGVADLLGRFCTQFFLFAWVGALIIALLLSAVQLLTLRLTSWGRLYGLTYVPSFLLWLFLLDEHALLGGVWAVVLMLLASWCFDLLPRGRWRAILLVAAVPLLYWIAGPVCVLFFLLQAPRPKQSPWYYGVFLLLAAVPFLLSFYLAVPQGSLWYGIHYYRYPTVCPVMLWTAVLSVFVLTLAVRTFFPHKATAKKPVASKRGNAMKGGRTLSVGSIAWPAASFLVVALGMGWLVWNKSNFKAEKVMHYDFMACHQQWNRILDTISAEKPNNQIGVTVQNLALAMRGLLTDHMFEYHQNGTAGLLPDVDTDATSPLPTAEAFYQLGMINVAQRTVFEAQEAILDFQKSARCYKRLAQTNLINGSYEVARKYLLALRKTLFYKDWANETLQLVGNEKAVDKHSEYGRLRRLCYDEDFFFSDHVTPEMIQSLFFSNTSNRLAYEYLMAAYLLTGDLENFANYVGWGEELGYPAIPRHFQEALILKWSFHHEKDEQLPVQVSQAIAQRFNQFYLYINSPTMTPEGLTQRFGDTYWCYYFTSIKQ